MTGFDEIRRSSCRIVDDDGRTVGTGFFILPDGHLLTCHHVVFGLERLRVAVWGDSMPRTAEYVAELSDATADIAVLMVPDPPACVQLAAVRERAAALGFGFRPSERNTEPSGHSFNGRLGPGQELQIVPEPELVDRLERLPVERRAPWNILPDEFRIGRVMNFDQVVGLERGISGGPVYDPALRRVVGLFRAVEGGTLGYVIPIENALVHWPTLLDRNADEVADEPLDRLAREFGVGLVAEGADLVLPRARRYFDQLFKDARRVGGRTRELARLDTFATGVEGGYLFATGPAGFGKTALLSRWLGELEGGAVTAAFHFIGRDESAAEVLQSLCEQLLSLHGLGGNIPASERDLRLLYADLLALAPPGIRGTVVVIDGLDEAQGRWDVGKDLFPESLASGMKVVFSAREMADRDWPASVGLSLGAANVLVLGRLDRGEVADATRRTSVVEDARIDEVASVIVALSAGDPFYVHDLLLELGAADGDLGSLKDLPHSHSEYLRRWWKGGLTDCGVQPFTDLMGSLAAAQGPLLREELIRLSPNDSLRGANIDFLLERAARYLIGGERQGYRLSHGRVHDFVETTLSDEINTYRRRLGEYCVAEARADMPTLYALLHGAGHVAEIAGVEALVAMLSPHWIHAKWMRLGSYGAAAEDFGAALHAALACDPLVTPLVVALSVARQTAREMTDDFPISLLIAWLKLGKTERVTTIARSLPPRGTHTVRTLIAVAGELLRSRRAEDEQSEAVELLRTAIELLPSIDLSEPQRSSVEATVTLIGTEGGLSRETALELLRLTSASVAQFRSFANRSLGYGTITETWVALQGDDENLRRILSDGIAAAQTVDHPAERIIATARLLPALRVAQSERADELLRSMLVDDTVLTTPTALGRPAVALIEALRRRAAPAQADAARAVRRITEGCLTAKSLDASALSKAAVAMVELGEDNGAAELFERVAARGDAPIAEANIALEMVEHLGSSSPTARNWAAQARNAIDRIPANAFPPTLVPRIVRTGDLEFALTLLDRHPGAVNLADECLVALSESHIAESDTAKEFAERLTSFPATRNQADPLAAAARALLAHGISEGASYADRAAAACSSDLPSGDTNILRELLAVALHEEGAYSKAVEVIAQMTSIQASKRAYQWLIEVGPRARDARHGTRRWRWRRTRGHPESVEPYARALAELRSETDDSLTAAISSTTRPIQDSDRPIADVSFDVDASVDALDQEIRALGEAIRADTTESPELLAFMKMLSDTQGDPATLKFQEVASAGHLARKAVHLGAYAPDRAAELLNELVDEILALTAQGDVASALGAMVESLSQAGADCRTHFEPFLSRVLRHTSKFTDQALREYVYRKAVGALIATGDYGWAQDVAERSGSQNLAQFTGWQIEAAANSASLNLFERRVVDLLGEPGAAWLTFIRKADPHQITAELIQDFAQSEDKNRLELLNRWIPMFAVLLRPTEGTDGIGAIVEEIEEIDKRFLDAAALATV